MNIFRSRLLCLLATLLLSGGLQGAEADDNGAGRFSSHDLDGDGYISLDEYKVFMEKRQARQQRHAGAGGRQLRYRRGAMRFVEIDRNGDGLISEEEMLAALNRRFEQPCPRVRDRQ
jgi:hypothetical protein